MKQDIPRTLPELEKHTESFWKGGQDGQLLINQCQDCQHYIHPPVPMCASCHSRNVAPTPVSGNAIVASYTINHMPWLPNLPVPYIFAVVELVEQQGLHLSTEIINTAPDEVTIGMPVTVTFEQQEDVFLPLFEPKEI